MRKWISLLTAVLLLALCACGADPTTTAAPQTTPTSTAPTTQAAVPTTVAPTTQPKVPTTAPDPMRAEDEFWGMYNGKVFLYQPYQGDKNQAPKSHRLLLYADGTYKTQLFTMNAGWISSGKGTWVFADGILTLSDSAYFEEFDAVHTYVTQLRYEDGVLIFMKGNNDIAGFIGEDDGIEYKYDSILE